MQGRRSLSTIALRRTGGFSRDDDPASPGGASPSSSESTVASPNDIIRRGLRQQRSSKQILRSSNGFASAGAAMRSSAGFRKLAAGTKSATAIRGVSHATSEHHPEGRTCDDAPAATDEAATAEDSESHMPREVCAICLEGLDDNGFQFPCGQDHKLHYNCMVSFIGSILALRISDEVEAPLSKEQVRNMGFGFKALAIIEGVLRHVNPVTRNRLCCPLCRCVWPEEEAVPLDAIMAQLRACRARGLGDQVCKMDEAFSRVIARADTRTEVQEVRMACGFEALNDNLHCASTFLLQLQGDTPAVLAILSFLETRHTGNLSQVSVTVRKLCCNSFKLRTGHVRSSKLRTATHHVSAADVMTLEIDPSLKASSRSSTALDVVTFVKWLRNASKLQVLSLTCLEWEKMDPGCSNLASNITMLRLRILDLSSNLLGDGSVKKLANALLDNTSSLQNLEIVDFSFNYITEAGLEAVLPLGRVPGSRVREWGFRHNKVGNGACKLLAEAFDPTFLRAKGPRLECWDLRTNGISAAGCQFLTTVLDQMVTARLGCNPLSDAGGENLSCGLGDKLRILDLSQGKLGDAAAIAMGSKFENCTSLEQLLLSGNDIGSMGANALADGWANVTSLRYVDLANNASIGSMGVALIADQMPIWKQAPFRLSLAGVECEEDGAKKLISVLSRNPRGDRNWVIELHNNPDIGNGSVVQINRLLEKRPTISADADDD
eukprot:TRINITY_DN104308_c0_g1_i1.p1 TRINITY_DN104308_c0_g1~~TRINITY_DN104308_c0_g1_i1.p1  ORF type:complete len:720 (-),score=86.47 TRINITY_DN104308_c0_g1_i1:129-2288(-)